MEGTGGRSAITAASIPFFINPEGLESGKWRETLIERDKKRKTTNVTQLFIGRVGEGRGEGIGSAGRYWYYRWYRPQRVKSTPAMDGGKVSLFATSTMHFYDRKMERKEEIADRST